MNKILFILFFLPIISFGQSIYSKDNIYLFERDEFIANCATAVNEKININGIDIETSSYCSCFCDQVVPELYSYELKEAYENNAIIDLFRSEKNLEIVLDCVSSNIKIEDNFNLGYKSFEEYSKTEMSMNIKACVLVARKNPEINDLLTADQIYSYCSCSIEKLIREGYTMGQLNMIDDENSESFNEVALPCFQKILLNKDNSGLFINEYILDDIVGDEYMSEVKLNNYLPSVYKIKINIDGVVKYFLFDTGATDLIINSDMERELIFNGSIKKEDYLGEQEFILADNSVVIGRVVRINNIKIGDYMVNNVIVSVLDRGSLLCGLGLLEKFRKWVFIKDSEILKIYK